MYNFLLMFAATVIPVWVWIVVALEVIGFAIAIPLVAKKVKAIKAHKASAAQEKALKQAQESIKAHEKQKADKTVEPKVAKVEQPQETKQEVVETKVEETKVEGQKVEETKVEETANAEQKTAEPDFGLNDEEDDDAAATEAPLTDSKDATYHISKRFFDDKWVIKLNDSKRAMRVFDTQAEALQYATELAQKKNGNVVVHKRSKK